MVERFFFQGINLGAYHPATLERVLLSNNGVRIQGNCCRGGGLEFEVTILID